MNNNDKKKKRSSKTLRRISKVLVVSAAVVGIGIITYKKVPVVKGFVDNLLSKKISIKIKPFRKYETL